MPFLFGTSDYTMISPKNEPVNTSLPVFPDFSYFLFPKEKHVPQKPTSHDFLHYTMDFFRTIYYNKTIRPESSPRRNDFPYTE